MTSVELQKYLDGCMQSELSIYTLEKTIKQLYIKYNSLGRKKVIRKPNKEKIDIFEIFFSIAPVAGVICAIIQAIAAFIWEFEGGFFGFLGAVFVAIVLAVFAFLGCGAIIGIIGTIIKFTRDKKQCEQEYNSDMAKYNNAIKKDNARVVLENKKKKALGAEIQTLEACLKRSKQHLTNMYSYNIIAPDYCNIYAVTSFFGYFSKGRTQCLHFDSKTGDQGAYNIYETERRLDKIITNTEEIINRLDEVILNQYDLAHGLQNATRQIDYLCSSVNSHINNISNTLDSIDRCQRIIAYNSETAARELQFANWIRMVY